MQDYCEELEYWGLTDLHLEPCCQHNYYRARWLLPQTVKQASTITWDIYRPYWLLVMFPPQITLTFLACLRLNLDRCTDWAAKEGSL